MCRGWRKKAGHRFYTACLIRRAYVTPVAIPFNPITTYSALAAEVFLVLGFSCSDTSWVSCVDKLI